MPDEGVRIWYWLALACLGVLLISSFQNFRFLDRAARTEGEVTRIEAANGRCGSSGKNSRRYDCTKFTGVVKFFTGDGSSYGLTVTGGESRGHGQPVSRSRLRVGQSYRVIYDSKRPETAYPDTFMGVWSSQVVLAVLAIITMVMSLTRRQLARRNRFN